MIDTWPYSARFGTAAEARLQLVTLQPLENACNIRHIERFGKPSLSVCVCVSEEGVFTRLGIPAHRVARRGGEGEDLRTGGGIEDGAGGV